MATSEKDQADQQDRKSHRSPAYPSMGLKAATEAITTIYKEARRAPTSVSVVAELFKTNIKSSKGLRLIAALKQYGFVVEIGSGDGRQVKLSDRALDIELGDTKEKRTAAIKAAALAPPLHRKVWDHFNGALPADATLKDYLLRKLDFNDAYVDRFIKQFRSTLAFAKIGKDDIIHGAVGEEEEPENEDETNGGKPLSALLPPKDETPVVRDFPIPLMSGGVAVVKVPVPMSESDFDQIKGTLEAWKSALVRPSKPDTE